MSRVFCLFPRKNIWRVELFSLNVCDVIFDFWTSTTLVGEHCFATKRQRTLSCSIPIGQLHKQFLEALGTTRANRQLEG